MAAALSNKRLPLLPHKHLIRISEPIREALSNSNINPPEGTNFPLKSTLLSLLPNKDSPLPPQSDESSIRREIRDFCLCCAALASVEPESGALMSAIPRVLSVPATAAFKELSEAIFGGGDESLVGGMNGECRLVVGLIPDVCPLLKGVIKESSIDPKAEEISAASARVPVGSAIMAAYQLRWFVTKVEYPYLGEFCNLAIPCALTAMDHWSAEVKGQAMVSLIHLMKHVNSAEIAAYEDVLLDASCQNIPSSDDLWKHVVQMSIILLTSTQRRNPRSPWFEKILNEMLSHLERQPKNAERRVAWLQLIDPVFVAMGLVLLAHFRRIFPLFFLWMHVDDDETISLVLERVSTILRLTWIRKSPYIGRLVDELTLVYKESAMRKEREAIRFRIVQIFVFLHHCMGPQLEAAWNKHKDDINLTVLASSFRTNIVSFNERSCVKS